MNLCECGCGQETAIATMTKTKDGVVKGQPNRFVNHHNTRVLRGELSSGYKGGRITRQSGYISVLIQPGHPYFSMGVRSGKYESYYVLEHRLVMAEWIHRPLRKEEVVHHKNGDVQDNSIENLALFHTAGAHHAYHRKKTVRANNGRFTSARIADDTTSSDIPRQQRNTP